MATSMVQLAAADSEGSDVEDNREQTRGKKRAVGVILFVLLAFAGGCAAVQHMNAATPTQSTVDESVTQSTVDECRKLCDDNKKACKEKAPSYAICNIHVGPCYHCCDQSHGNCQRFWDEV